MKNMNHRPAPTAALHEQDTGSPKAAPEYARPSMPVLTSSQIPTSAMAGASCAAAAGRLVLVSPCQDDQRWLLGCHLTESAMLRRGYRNSCLQL
jgi:hypothetical protein